jgi:hypothetical protein
MKIDQHPFLAANVNMVEFGEGKTIALTSQRVRESGLVDPKVQILADEVKGNDHRSYQNGQHEIERASGSACRPRVKSQMLLNKYRCQQKRDRRRQEAERQDHESHWRCPFYAYCWNEGLRLPSI